MRKSAILLLVLSLLLITVTQMPLTCLAELPETEMVKTFLRDVALLDIEKYEITLVNVLGDNWLYHLTYEKKAEEAAEARQKAHDIALVMLQDKKYKGIEKELYYIAGAMKYMLNDHKSALQDFKKAQQSIYEKSGMDKISQGNFNDFLNRMLDAYIDRIEIQE